MKSTELYQLSKIPEIALNKLLIQELNKAAAQIKKLMGEKQELENELASFKKMLPETIEWLKLHPNLSPEYLDELLKGTVSLTKAIRKEILAELNKAYEDRIKKAQKLNDRLRKDNVALIANIAKLKRT
ncbi:MAG: hypothetical protein LBT50_12010 [Prevotellaceae bacterium]|jgi:hypothetical protein|nr:hypothetical protein [Prevotellaceae bacterium]